MDERIIFKRMMESRMEILRDYPFFGSLLLHLRMGLAECNTAFTDMSRIVFDPEFAHRLPDGELSFVMLHELMHCVLQHPIRGDGKQSYVYNVACDIVVNSLVMGMMGLDEMSVDGSFVMHLAPDGSEGRTKSAEEIYMMLMQKTPEEMGKIYGFSFSDEHGAWSEIKDVTLGDLWNQYVKKAAKSAGTASGIPDYMERYLKEVSRHPRTNWRQILHDFIQFDRSDYLFSRPDRRFSGDVIMPSFCENVDGSAVEKLWFAVDTSGSISDEALSVAYEEIRQAMEQIGSLRGLLSFFDGEVSDPIPFESVEDLLKIKPIGGGGTSFQAIFRKLAKAFDPDDLPVAMIILTDGYSTFPDEEKAMGVPVIWIIVDSDVVPPWGVYTSITT